MKTQWTRRELVSLGGASALRGATSYADGRPATRVRLDATDSGGPVLRHGHGPAQCDIFGAREAVCFRANGLYYLHYDGAGPNGWLACLAISRDLVHWNLKGPVLSLGEPGSDDSGTASSPWTVFDGKLWHMFYVGCRTTSPPPNRIPSVPYFTLAATSLHPAGPWTKQRNLIPFHTTPGTYYADTASPGQIVKHGNEYLMFFSAAAFTNEPKKRLLRTVSIARTQDLNGTWTVDRTPTFPPQHQIENSALYFEKSNRTWFLFTNHVGLDQQDEYTESIWVYWTPDLNRWDPEHRAVVLDRSNCRWAKRSIGMPSVVPRGKKLALFYDSSAENGGNMGRDIGLAWIDLPLRPPSDAPR